jgi:steroid delta-isomerase-like uncharacterized protein
MVAVFSFWSLAMSAETYHLITELVNAWNAYDLERLCAFYTPEYEGVDVAQAEPQHGPAGIRQMAANYWQAFPDLCFTTERIVLDGDQLAIFWMAQGTHQGVFMRIPATGKAIEVRGVSLLTLESGKIKRAHYIWDVAGLLRSIGLLPDLL